MTVTVVLREFEDDMLAVGVVELVLFGANVAEVTVENIIVELVAPVVMPAEFFVLATAVVVV